MKNAQLQNAINSDVTIEQLHPQKISPNLLSFCKAMADQLRLDILKVLSKDSFGVLELGQIFNCKQSLISHHLKILANVGLVLRRREGNSIFYRRAHSFNSEAFSDLQKGLYQSIEKQVLKDETLERLVIIHNERANKSQSYFRDNSDHFSHYQEQVAAYELYGPNAIEMISSSFDSQSKVTKSVLEVGPGDGEFLFELSGLFNEVIALDNSLEMLTMSKNLAKEKCLDNLEFVLGDTTSDAIKNKRVDCVVLNMVLHHVPSPAEVLEDLTKVLKQGGQLFITELCAHDQTWVKASCGDLWMGFEAEDLNLWARNVGLIEGESIYLAQRNGFRVQIRQYLKCVQK